MGNYYKPRYAKAKSKLVLLISYAISCIWMASRPRPTALNILCCNNFDLPAFGTEPAR